LQLSLWCGDLFVQKDNKTRMRLSDAVNLDELWVKGIDDRPAVIDQQDRLVSRKELFSAALELSHQIVGKKVAIFCKSSKLETIAFLAAIRTASSIILPSTNQPEALKEIRKEFDVLLTDGDAPDEIETIRVLDNSVVDLKLSLETETRVDPDFTVSFFTSGSTGKPKEIRKRFYQLANEVQVWEDMYGVELVGSEVHAMVSHQHVYGLLFRLLWPLASGRPFRSDTASSWEEVSTDTKEGRPFVLVSSPTHLSRLTPLEDAEVSVKPVITFSSGGSIQDEYAMQSARYLGRPVLEIYGSTETGGVAKRYNSGSNEIWVPLPNVDVSQNEHNCLQLTSSFLRDKSEVHSTEDLVSFTQDGSFTLLGRADRIVKIEGKRVSLPRLEALLLQNELVKDVTAKVVGSESPQLAAVVELKGSGTDYLSEHGSFRTGRHLRKYLGQFDDAVTSPKRWLFVEELPRNTQGKIVAGDIDTLFKNKVENVASVRQVFEKTTYTEISRNVEDKNAEIQLVIDDDLDFFRGHFTDNPILPGVVQLHWAVKACSEIFEYEGQPEKIEKLKFKAIVFPNMTLNLFLQKQKNGKVTFLYQSMNKSGETVEHSSGTLNYGERYV